MWQEQVPRAPRDLVDLPERADVVVVGAGYCGLGAAESAAGAGADVLVLDIPDYRHVGYRFGTNLVETVIKRGAVV